MNTTSKSNPRGRGAFKYELLLLLVSMIWGSAFVAQQIGMAKGLGPMTFNGLRFALGCLSLIPVIIWRNKNLTVSGREAELPYKACLGAGLFLFAAAAFQQIGLQYTSRTRLHYHESGSGLCRARRIPCAQSNPYSPRTHRLLLDSVGSVDGAVGSDDE
jgi:hypothetical protein